MVVEGGDGGRTCLPCGLIESMCNLILKYNVRTEYHSRPDLRSAWKIELVSRQFPHAARPL